MGLWNSFMRVNDVKMILVQILSQVIIHGSDPLYHDC